MDPPVVEIKSTGATTCSPSVVSTVVVPPTALVVTPATDIRVYHAPGSLPVRRPNPKAPQLVAVVLPNDEWLRRQPEWVDASVRFMEESSAELLRVNAAFDVRGRELLALISVRTYPQSISRRTGSGFVAPSSSEDWRAMLFDSGQSGADLSGVMAELGGAIRQQLQRATGQPMPPPIILLVLRQAPLINDQGSLSPDYSVVRVCKDMQRIVLPQVRKHDRTTGKTLSFARCQVKLVVIGIGINTHTDLLYDMASVSQEAQDANTYLYLPLQSPAALVPLAKQVMTSVVRCNTSNSLEYLCRDYQSRK